MFLLKDYKTIVITGNHDTNIKNAEDIDLISPLLDGPNIVFQKESALFEVSGVKFHHISMFEDAPSACEDASGRVLLYHGFANGAKFGTHQVNDAVLTREICDKYKLVLLGDIHEHQFISPTIAYAGSLIQQNLGEGRNKGIIIWTLSSRTGQFMRIQNECELIRFDLRGKSVQECADIIARENVPSKLLKLSIITDSDDNRASINAIESKFGRINTIRRVFSDATVINPNKDILDTLASMLDQKGVSMESRDHILLTHQNTLSVQERRRWSVLSLEWSNMLKYGAKPSKIDFTKLEGALSGVIGNNCLGKSSIIDILVYSLFGTLLRDTKETFIHYGAARSWVRVVFQVNGEKYCVRRVDNRNARKTNTVEFMKYVFMNGTSMEANATEEWTDAATNSTGVIDTNQRIAALIGTKEQFLATSLYTTTETDILKTDGVRRLSLLSTLFGMIDPANILKQISADKKETDTAIRSLVKPKDPDSPLKITPLTEKLLAVSKQYETIAMKRKSLQEQLRELDIKYGKIRPPHLINADIQETNKKITVLRARIDALNDKIEIDVPFMSEVSLTDVERELANSCEPDISSVFDAINELRIKQAPLIKVKPTTKYTKTSLLEIKDQIGVERSDSRINIVYDDNCAHCQQNRLIINKLIGEVSLSKLSALEEQYKIAEREIALYNEQLRSYYDYVKLDTQIKNLESQTSRARAISAAIEKVGAHYKYEQYLLGCELKNAENSLTSLSERLIVLNEERTNALNIDPTISAALREKIVIAERIMNDASKQMGELNAQIKATTEDARIAENYTAKSVVLQRKYDEQTAYYDCLKSNSLKLLAISKMMKLVVDNTNHQLKELTDFALDFEIKENSLDILIVEANGLRKPIRAGSGFQNAIISVCFRLTLTTLLGSTAEFIIMDEPLQYVDEENIGKILDMLAMMPSIYKFVFIISHISDLKQIIALPLQIKVIGAASYINCDNSTIKQIDSDNDVVELEPAKKQKRVKKVVDESNTSAVVIDSPKDAPKDEITIVCELCNKEVKKKSYNAHTKSATHINNVNNMNK
jgi:DNA repair exonuclease SbcCD ATPase subunit